MRNKKSLCFVLTEDWTFFVYNRYLLAEEAVNNGFTVTIIAKETSFRSQIEAIGYKFIPIRFSRGKGSILNELLVVFQLFNIFLRKKYSVVNLIGIKIIIFGTIAARLSFSKSKYITLFTGLGSIFISKNNSISIRLILKVFSVLSDINVHHIFQNKDDYKLISLIINIKQYNIIKGSGVEVDLFKFKELPEKKPKEILFIGRLIKEKGILELIEAAQILKNELFGKVKFILIGDLDEYNPSKISKGFIESQEELGYLEWHGFINDVKTYIENSYSVVLPSYREGLPKSLIEACSIGRPIITSDAVGCKDVVIDGYNGFIIPIGDSVHLASKILELVRNLEMAKEFGRNSRIKAEKEFDIKIIAKEIIQVFNSHC